MNKKSIKIGFLEYNSVKELENSLKQQLISCENSLKNAYAPYSKFRVSAMCVLSDGTEIIGTNQENAAYPSGQCAERVAVFSAHSQFPNRAIAKIIITTDKSTKNPTTPCGACRQVLIEFEQNQEQNIEVILKSGNSKIWHFDKVSDLLPFAFSAKVLKNE